ncbi:NAD-dependent succinate-semialdehyde dehydrogenase [Aeromicrobium fastidiosum]|uniref:NAD-dependent succinate-semialdehyde dehydrogenase n=1 Tax=Aeromicrobium fastidiosum TaxID=52699 RepID=A0A641ARJ0_9ACTN|nr:NAD-dependent succinate-semialdehyde dehydrogenase [Aeromicrobium fastidiosum]KAA1380559.1 NAD-dependent succinate-semialdehyde dehydrogenase [Aeromicrobium fastidiosum]MBP2390153.1 succinate-semialdehyde dehydrogenase/glutarate-semialdehyde dehydrogenase [Aeromicrobium fastidiosum]
MTATDLFIDNQWLPGANGTFDVVDPATGESIRAVSDASEADATAAVDAAATALKTWRRVAPRERGEILRRTWELMIRDRDELGELIAAENGKSLTDAKGEVTYAAEFFRWFAEEGVRMGGDYGVSPAGGTRTLVTHHPVGVAALVTPWNFPAAMATRKIAPALAAGCTVVLKPAAETPLTAFAIARLMVEAGLPEGVVNIVPSSTAGKVVTTWMEDARVRKISFTGSTGIGSVLLKQAADRIVNSSMELGGNAPLIVADDADLDAAVEGTMIAKFRGGGQACTAANRLYVHADVVEEFAAKLGAKVASLKVGPASEGSDIGPLINAKAVDKTQKLLAGALEAGARVTHEASVPQEGEGFWFAPTVLVDVPADAEIVHEEIFGPIAPIVTWTTDEEVIGYANDTEMGLAAYVFTGDLQRGIRLGEAIEAGMVGVNRGLVSDPAAPFGGMKQSGIGREGGRMGLEEFQETQYLSVAWPDA